MMAVCTLAGAYRIPEGLLFGCVPDFCRSIFIVRLR